MENRKAMRVESRNRSEGGCGGRGGGGGGVGEGDGGHRKLVTAKGCLCNHCRQKMVLSMPRNSGSRRNSSRQNSCSKIYTGDEHWTKVLQASEGQGSASRQKQQSFCDRCHCLHPLAARSRHCSLSSSHGAASALRNFPKKRSKNLFQSLYSRFCDWFGSSCNGFGSSFLMRFTSCSHTSYDSLKNGSKEGGGGRGGGGGGITEGRVDAGDGSPALPLVQPKLGNGLLVPSKDVKESPHVMNLFNDTSQSSEESECGSVWTSSSSSSLTVASNSTISSTEGCILFSKIRQTRICYQSTCLPNQACISERAKTSNGLVGQVQTNQPTRTNVDLKELVQKNQPIRTNNDMKEQVQKKQPIRTNINFITQEQTTDCHLPASGIGFCQLKHSCLSLADKETKTDVLSSTWTFLKEHRTCKEDPGKTDRVTSSPSLLPTEEAYNGKVTSDEVTLRESSIEWSIAYDDLAFDKMIRCGARHQIHRGRWHGDVLIHTYCDLQPMEVTEFLKLVSELSRIRHENICLFMGACIHLPNLAVVTSDLKGPSLYEKLHLYSDKMSMRSRVSIARQVSVAMGYLHAKGVLARKLNSRNIHLEPKVKLSLLDHGMAETVHQRSNAACLPRGNLCYVAPEMLSTAVIIDSRLRTTYSSTPETDVFAFGTLLYELFAEQFPFSGNSVETLIWRMCKGRQPPLTHLNCNSAIKGLIERCWSQPANSRPSFSEINQELQQKTGLHKCHSSSQPERLNLSTFQTGRPLPYRMARQQ